MKSVLDTRPIFHQRDEKSGVTSFCSFLALVIRKELDSRLEKAGHCFEWADIKQDLKALQEITIEDRGKTLVSAANASGPAGRCLQAVGVAIRRRSGRWHDAKNVVKEQSVGAKNFFKAPIYLK